MNLIVAMCKNRGIGLKGNLPWGLNLKNDLNNFKKMTIGNGNNAVIMGNVTALGIPKFPLRNRDNLVLSKKNENINEDINLNYFQDKINMKKYIADQYYSDVWIIGGSKIYNQFIQDDDVRKIYVTEVLHNFECDTFFPNIPSRFQLKSESDIFTENSISYRYKMYKDYSSYMTPIGELQYQNKKNDILRCVGAI